MTEQTKAFFILGVTGGIASGQDIVCQMLARLGTCYIDVIDVDVLANQAFSRDAPGFQLVVKLFGPQMLTTGGEIDRLKLQRHLQTDPSAQAEFKAQFHAILHQAVDFLIGRAEQPVVIVKAVDLVQNNLMERCDAIWVVQASEQVRSAILERERGLSHEQALQVIHSQLEPDPGIIHPKIVLQNSGRRQMLWKHVSAAWRALCASQGIGPVFWQASPIQLPERKTASVGTAPIPVFTVQPIATNKSAVNRTSFTELRLVARRLGNALSTLLIIAYITSLGLILAERGREHLPARPFEAAWQALVRTAGYIFQHPQIYAWKKDTFPAFELISQTLENSAGLLLLALGVALLLGLALGFAAAFAKDKSASALIMLISVLGTSMPSFLFAMFLWVINIWAHKTFEMQVLPSAGFGWDAHLVMPVLVLSMRPLAQIAQVTYVALRDIIQKDYIRTAQAKGLSQRIVRNRHMLPNILIPTLTTLGASLRFSLASLPVVELFFAWPGVGLTLLQAIEQGNAPLVTDLILSLGTFFLAVNLAIELFFPLIDPRLRASGEEEKQEDRQSFLGWSRGLIDTLGLWLKDFRQRFTRRPSSLPPLPSNIVLPPMDKDRPTISKSKWILRNLLSNPSILIGSVLLIALIVLAATGENLTQASPYQVHGVMMVGGKIGSPPYPPSETFPWGTDQIGRDIQALVLAGGKRTLALAFFSMLARVFIGAVLGALAGWQRNGWLDRVVTGAVGVWAAFPVTLFAMLIIQALGIQQGMWVFVAALSFVGWGEVAQFVRAQVISLKPQLFVESARSIGSRSDQIIGRHILPNLVNSLIVLAVLEMGGSLMLLAELGFLNIFMGGGFKAAIGEVGMMTPVVAHFSDVPEWAALIANVRDYWRTYNWMALYPGLAIFLSIMAFNLFGEGLRRFLDDSHANLSRLFNRYTLLAGVSLAVIVSLLLRSSTPLGVYYNEGLKFDEQRVMQDIQALSALEMQGRETGTQGAELASAYIARRMAEIGVFPAGEKNTYIQRLVQPRPHLFETPKLTLLENPPIELVYRKDFAEYVRQINPAGDITANVIGAAFGQIADPTINDSFGLGNSPVRGQVMLIRIEDAGKIYDKPLKGLLVVADETFSMQRKDAFPNQPVVPFNVSLNAPISMLISPEVADRLLKSAGSSLAELDSARASLKPGEKFLTKPGMQVELSLNPRNADDFTHEAFINVLGNIPGEGHYVGMEDQVIIVSAYYDGVGTDLNGTVYPGANDNASGVAMLLELARLMKASPYKPDKTVLFVAWGGGERSEGLSVDNIMNARAGANELTVETVIELSGVGYGTGKSIALGEQSSYRMVKLFQDAADRYNLPTTTRGRSPHYGRETRPGFGDRDAMTLSISWDGSDNLVHTPQDVPAIIDPQKLHDIGRSTYLTLLVLSRETEY